MESSREQQIQLIELVKNIMPDTPDVRQVINEAIREFGSTNKRAEQEYEKIQQETTVPKRRREIMERYSEDEDDDEDENPPVKKTPKDSDAVTDPSKSEEKGHVCPVCDEAFGDELQLETHMELQHPDDYA